MSPTETIANLKDIVFKGPFRDQGMPDFTGKLKEEDIAEAPGLHPGHRRRDPAEVTEVIPGRAQATNAGQHDDAKQKGCAIISRSPLSLARAVGS